MFKYKYFAFPILSSPQFPYSSFTWNFYKLRKTVHHSRYSLFLQECAYFSAFAKLKKIQVLVAQPATSMLISIFIYLHFCLPYTGTKLFFFNNSASLNKCLSSSENAQSALLISSAVQSDIPVCFMYHVNIGNCWLALSEH